MDKSPKVTVIPPVENPLRIPTLPEYRERVFAVGKRKPIQVATFRQKHGRPPERGELCDEKGNILPYSYEEWCAERSRLQDRRGWVTHAGGRDPIWHEYGGPSR